MSVDDNSILGYISKTDGKKLVQQRVNHMKIYHIKIVLSYIFVVRNKITRSKLTIIDELSHMRRYKSTYARICVTYVKCDARFACHIQ